MEFRDIYSIFLNVTNQCNCRCRYCWEEHNPNFMTYQVAKDAADFVISNAEKNGLIPSINFFGGEPTLCWDSIIVPLTKYIRQEYNKPFNLSITSNCLLLDDKKMDFMIDNDIGLLFSIDGDKETQNYNRPTKSGKSCFDILKVNIPLISKRFPNTTFRSTAIPETCENTFENIMFAYNNGYSKYFVIPNVFQEWDSDSRKIMGNEMRKYSDWCISCFNAGNIPGIIFDEYEKAYVKIQKINTAIVNNIYRDEFSCGACAKCGLGVGGFASVDYIGNIYACQELVNPKDIKDNPFYIGNIYTGVDIEKREKLSSLFNTKMDRTSKCSDCKLDRICNGHCVANNYMINGDVNKATEVSCWWYNLILDEAIYICNQLGENEAFIRYWTVIHDGGRF